jgi:hypothetical protein
MFRNSSIDQQFPKRIEALSYFDAFSSLSTREPAWPMCHKFTKRGIASFDNLVAEYISNDTSRSDNCRSHGLSLAQTK